MKIFLLLICSFQSIVVFGQVFNNRYILDQTSMAFHNIFTFDDTLVTVGFGSTFYQPFPAKLMVTTFNRMGEELDYDVVMEDSLTGYFPVVNSASIFGRKIIVSGGAGGSLNNRFGFYALYDIDNGLEWLRELEIIENNQQLIFSGNLVKDNHILLLRGDILGSGIAITTVSEVDAEGETVWERSFGSGGINHRPGRVVALSDSTYLIGLEKYPNSGSGPNIHTFLVKIDNVGNILSSWDDQSTRTYAPREMVPLNDGGLIYVSRYLTAAVSNTNPFPDFQGYIVRQDADYNILWTLKTGDPTFRTDLFSMIRTAK